MGKGDKKTKRGKISRGSFGNTRPHKVKKGALETMEVPRSSASKTGSSTSKLKSPKGGNRVVHKVSRKTQETPHEVASAVGIESADNLLVSTPSESKKVPAETPLKEKKATKAPAVKKAKSVPPQQKESKGSSLD